MNTCTLINRIINGSDLSIKEASNLLEEIIQGQLNSVQVAAMLVALRSKGETVDEIIGFIMRMRKHMIKIKASDAVDIVGTGGDGTGTFNISTASSFIAAGAGVPIAKHGNRAASSKCGSADVLESLGVNISLTPKQAEQVFQRVGMVFLFAPVFHPTMKSIAFVRKELGIRTIFNLLGPFLSPASAKRILLGVPSVEIAKKLSLVAAKLNFTHLLLIASEDGMDEITTTAKTIIFEVKGSKVKLRTISPEEFGIKLTSKEDIAGGDGQENAGIIQNLLKGERGPRRDIVILNSAAAFYVAGKAKSIADGISIAEKSIDSGAALKVLENLIKETQKYA